MVVGAGASRWERIVKAISIDAAAYSFGSHQLQSRPTSNAVTIGVLSRQSLWLMVSLVLGYRHGGAEADPADPMPKRDYETTA